MATETNPITVWTLTCIDPTEKNPTDAIFWTSVYSTRNSALDAVYENELDNRVEFGDEDEQQAGEMAAKVRRLVDEDRQVFDYTAEGVIYRLEDTKLNG